MKDYRIGGKKVGVAFECVSCGEILTVPIAAYAQGEHDGVPFTNLIGSWYTIAEGERELSVLEPVSCSTPLCGGHWIIEGGKVKPYNSEVQIERRRGRPAWLR